MTPAAELPKIDSDQPRPEITTVSKFGAGREGVGLLAIR